MWVLAPPVQFAKIKSRQGKSFAPPLNPCTMSMRDRQQVAQPQLLDENSLVWGMEGGL